MRHQIESMDTNSLEKLGLDAYLSLKSGDVASLAKKYGYALSFQQSAEDALRADYLNALQGRDIQQSDCDVVVTHFNENESGLASLIECHINFSDSKGILLELVITKKNEIYIEQIGTSA